MRRLFGKAVLVLGLAAALAAPLQAAIIYGPDTFDAGDDGWTTWTGFSGSSNIFTRTDIGNGDYAMAASGSTARYAVKKTATPKMMTLDLDIKAGFRSSQGNNNFFKIMFHLDPFLTSGYVGSRHYELKWVKGWAANPPAIDYSGLQLWEKAATDVGTNLGAFTMLADTNAIPFDSDPHKIRITDDGTGKINVYFDDMTTPVLSVDDSASYTATANDCVAIELGNQITGGQNWFQNVTVYDTVVPEPATLALLSLAGLALLRRRQAL